MSDEKLAPVLRSWLKTREVAPPDATQSVAHVMARVPRTRQRGHWWPMPVFGRASVAPPAVSSTALPPTPIPSTHGHTLTITGRTHVMFSPVKVIAAAALAFALGSVALIAQPFDQQGGSVPGAAPGDAEVASETLFELTIPSAALPDDFAYFVVEDLTLAADTVSIDDYRTSQANESMRGRAFLVESGEFLFEPTADALLWQGSGTEPKVAPAGEAVTVRPGEAIFLPAMSDTEVDGENYLRIANLGSEDATARSFHTCDLTPFGGLASGLSIGDWNEGGHFGHLKEPFAGVDVLFRLTRWSGGPGAAFPMVDPPALAHYFVESGTLEWTASGPGGESTKEWQTGRDFFPPLLAEVEQTLAVMGDDTASVLELVAIPMSK